MITDEMVRAAEAAYYGAQTEAMRAALEAADRASWQTMESAPRNGTKVLTWHPVHDLAVTWWCDDMETWRDVSDPWTPGESPTHWRPLPPTGDLT